MNQGEWELLGVLTQFQEFSIESSDSYAEMKFYVSGAHPGILQGGIWGKTSMALSQRQGALQPQQSGWGNTAALSLNLP